MTTLTLSTGTLSRALKINLGGGKTLQFLYSSLTNLARSAKYGLSNSSFNNSFHDCSRRTSIGIIVTSFIPARSLQGLALQAIKDFSISGGRIEAND